MALSQGEAAADRESSCLLLGLCTLIAIHLCLFTQTIHIPKGANRINKFCSNLVIIRKCSSMFTCVFVLLFEVHNKNLVFLFFEIWDPVDITYKYWTSTVFIKSTLSSSIISFFSSPVNTARNHREFILLFFIYLNYN